VRVVQSVDPQVRRDASVVVDQQLGTVVLALGCDAVEATSVHCQAGRRKPIDARHDAVPHDEEPAGKHVALVSCGDGELVDLHSVF
jgi:hypothetical protein